MAKGYDHKAIEAKWQRVWEEQSAFKAPENPGKEKLYVLDMFPYPSGDGLHVGHVESYTATDVYSRYQRMRGREVLHPMGWDAFGLPAENYAIKTGVHPQKTTDQAVDNFRRQIKSLGLSYDWSREVGTHTPEYYKWTQWFFLFLYKNGLAEKRLAKVNWCPKDQTVLANEQTVSESGEKGVCVRCGTKVIQKDLEQWFFKITDFADALVDDLDQIDWPESTKINQRNWIGRSEGALIRFEIRNPKSEIEVFTTRPDTLFGATYLVLAPEHALVKPLLERCRNQDEILAYLGAAANKTELERTMDEKEKTGVELKGVKAINPANNAEIPIFIADYVLGGYGTGAIMAVPAHDERDYAFAVKFDIPIVQVVEPVTMQTEGSSLQQGVYTGPGILINSGEFTGSQSEDARRRITESVGGRMVKQFRLRDWLISRQRYWGAPIPIVYDPQGRAHPVPEEHLPWVLTTDVEFKPTGTSPLGQSKELLERTERIFGKGWRPEVDTMDTFVCSSWYFFRFTDPHNDIEFASKEAIQKWLPVDLYMGGAEHTVLHLLYARFFTKALQRFGYIGFAEPFLKLRHQGVVLAEDGSKMSKSKGNVINPDDYVEQYGADALRMYEMFMGPLEAMKPWSTKNIAGVSRFLERVWKLAQKPLTEEPASTELESMLHKTAKKVGEDIEALKFNTAISQLMICLNTMEEAPALRVGQWKAFVRLLAPFAPHLAEELWQQFGQEGLISLAEWPQYDESKIVAATVVVAVQVNGKTRASVVLSPSATEDEALAAAREAAQKWLTGPEKKAIYIPGRIVSFQV